MIWIGSTPFRKPLCHQQIQSMLGDINLVESKVRDQAVLSAGINEAWVRMRLPPASTQINIGKKSGKKLGKKIEKSIGKKKETHKKLWGRLPSLCSIVSIVQESMGTYRSTTKRIRTATHVNSYEDKSHSQFAWLSPLCMIEEASLGSSTDRCRQV